MRMKGCAWHVRKRCRGGGAREGVTDGEDLLGIFGGIAPKDGWGPWCCLVPAVVWLLLTPLGAEGDFGKRVEVVRSRPPEPGAEAEVVGMSVEARADAIGVLLSVVVVGPRGG